MIGIELRQTQLNQILNRSRSMMPARRIHALLVAANLFWYQAIRQTVGVLAVAMGHELHYSASEKGWLIAHPRWATSSHSSWVAV